MAGGAAEVDFQQWRHQRDFTAQICGVGPRQKASTANFADALSLLHCSRIRRRGRYYTLQNVQSGCSDPLAASEIDARLAACGFDAHAINVEVYVQDREILVLFESLLNAAQTKRMLLLREIRNQRWPGASRSRIANGAPAFRE